jgi:hypothetical protein
MTIRQVLQSDAAGLCAWPAASDQIEKMRASSGRAGDEHPDRRNRLRDGRRLLHPKDSARDVTRRIAGSGIQAGRLQVSPMVCSAMRGAEPFTAFASRSYGSSGRSWDMRKVRQCMGIR